MHSYSVGFQRSIGRDMAFEVRYVGNQNMYTWAEENWNERNVVDERLPRRVQDGTGQPAGEHRGQTAAPTFAYTGAPGTSPLPIHLAYLNGSARRGQSGGVHVDQLHQLGVPRAVQPAEPQVVDGADGARDTTATFRTNAVTPATARTSSS